MQVIRLMFSKVSIRSFPTWRVPRIPRPYSYSLLVRIFFMGRPSVDGSGNLDSIPMEVRGCRFMILLLSYVVQVF